MPDKFGFPWEQDAIRAKKGKKSLKRVATYRSMKAIGPRKHLKKKKPEPWWYQEYLKSPHWQDFKLRYSQSSLPKTCVKCGNKEVDLHHRTYKRLGEEHLSDVVPLCRGHHQATHNLVKQGVDLWEAHTKI